ncbi:hypothetical protein Aca07nite_02490 [Actinoplanes capillaceus]|uniref:AAA domain-containing protein n=1 Tax=Actinoplanes campanulatus TaxID=113559 RepID=A0ABQ3W7F1_9ACTN|nr:hypothetical protein [Actinoplanes capillaceus]GID42974.1 hypothetical protein Aca07nite_02490 [Actinoplanes capillaceus]
MTGTLLFIVGPPAVGKMTVGERIAARTGLRLFHNHLAIEPVPPRRSPGGSRFDDRPDYLRIDNTHHEADEVAEMAITHFRLATI